jgi:large subunit ribosomal protein L10e
MALRKASAYSKMKVVPFTRISKQKGKAYIKTVPPQSIVKFTMGSEKLYREGKFPHELTVVATERAQIRHNALEACRQYLNKRLDVDLAGQYLFRVVPFPHHIQRENKMLTGAGADRMSSGMQLSYGKPMGKAALVKNGTRVFFFAVPNEKAVAVARDAFSKVRPKLPCKTRVLYQVKKGAAIPNIL